MDPRERLKTTLKAYGDVARLVDREVMSWSKLPSEQQQAMDGVIVSLNQLSSVGSESVSTEAQFALGVIYENGRGIPSPRPARAAEAYQAAAEGGCKEALYNLAGLMRTVILFH